MVFLFFFFFDKKYRYNSADSSPALFFNAWILKYVSFVINQKKKSSWPKLFNGEYFDMLHGRYHKF